MNILEIDPIQLIISIIGAVYYGAYSLVYGLYESVIAVLNPLFEVVTTLVNLIFDGVLTSVLIIGVLPTIPAFLLVTLCTMKMAVLFVRFVLRVVETLPTVDGGFLRF